MALTPPIVAADFKAFFTREFIYGAGLDNVRDADINRAITDALLVFNPNLWDSTTEDPAFLYATAHFLAMAIQAAGGLKPVATNDGTRNRADGVPISKTVGDVSISYAEPPEIVKKFAGLLPFWETSYGRTYVQMLAPRLIGAVVSIKGEQNPDTADWR